MEKLEENIQLLKEGKSIALISDAGTPLISDPGNLLVKACIEANIEVVAIPGPCALIHALTCSGLSSERFQFVGFLPKKEKELRKNLAELAEYAGVSIAYESPERIEKTLETLADINSALSVCISRELTKKFETHIRGTTQYVLDLIKANPLKGECVLLIAGTPRTTDFSSLSVEEHVQNVQDTYQVPKREAIKIVAGLRNLNKRELYRSFHNPSETD
jgi:16S rRNA (cytidine1402-2'-O)-methyltransferase